MSHAPVIITHCIIECYSVVTCAVVRAELEVPGSGAGAVIPSHCVDADILAETTAAGGTFINICIQRDHRVCVQGGVVGWGGGEYVQ